MEIKEVKVTAVGGNTPNIFICADGKLIAKLWIYPDGMIRYRSFVPKTTGELPLIKIKR